MWEPQYVSLVLDDTTAARVRLDIYDIFDKFRNPRLSYCIQSLF